MYAQLQAIADILDRLAETTGRVIAWLTLGMVLTTATIVMLRYLFNSGSIALQESVTYLHATVFMLGAAYTLKHDGHVRVDIIYQKLSPCARAWVDLLGTLLFLLPLCLFLGYKSWDFVVVSWQLAESSREPGGMPYPFVPLLKSVTLVMPLLLVLQGIAMLIRALQVLRGRQ